MKVCICIPAQDMLHTTFFNAMFQAAFYARNKGIEIVMSQMNGCYLDLLRNQLIQSALETKPDFILMADSDMIFPNSTIERLAGHDKEIVGCNYTRRRPPYDPIACSGDGNTRINPILVKGVEPVAIIPTGLLMIKPSVFDKIAYPWFETIWRKKSPEGKPENRLIGEDVVFCAKAGDLKIPIYCDHDLSRHVKHSGQFDFGFEHLQ
jgi:hypothetical protein